MPAGSCRICRVGSLRREALGQLANDRMKQDRVDYLFSWSTKGVLQTSKSITRRLVHASWGFDLPAQPGLLGLPADVVS